MRVINYEDSGCTFEYYDSFSSIANIQVPKHNMSKWRDTVSHNSYRWLGVEGGRAKLREIVELYGWQKGVDDGLQALGEISAPTLPSIKKKKCFSSYGHTLNIGRMYSGSLTKAWRSTKRELSAKKYNKKGLTNLIIDFSSNCNVNSEAFFWRGALGIVLAQALMASGRKVRILACCSCDGLKKGRASRKLGEKNLTIAMLVKDYTQRIEYNTMFAITALSGFFRHYIFKAFLSQPYKVTSGLGHASELKISRLNPILDDNPIIMVENIWDKATAIRKANNITKELEA